MEKLHGNFYADRSPVYELFILMLQVSDYKDPEKDTYHKPEIEKMNQWIAEQRKSIPEHILDELNVFFHPDSFFGLSMIQVVYQFNKYGDIEESLEFLKSADAKKMIYFFFNTGHNSLENESIIDNPSEVHKHIKNSTLTLPEKSKLFYLYFDPEETKERFVNLIQHCYEQLYKPIKNQLETIHTQGLENIKRLSDQQLKEIIRFDSDSDEKLPETIVIFPSYYHQDNSVFSYASNADIAISIVGMQMIEDKMEGTNTEEKVIELARALSDSKRITIIRELNKAPYYGFELAQRLNLSSPTISHHMNILFRLGLVTTSKYENKIYYEVSKEKLKQSLAEMTDLLT